jgi:hypothetical protein
MFALATLVVAVTHEINHSVVLIAQKVPVTNGTKLRVETDAESGRRGDAEIFLNKFSPCPPVPASPRRVILVPFVPVTLDEVFHVGS